jgi:hypothetical protein
VIAKRSATNKYDYDWVVFSLCWASIRFFTTARAKKIKLLARERRVVRAAKAKAKKQPQARSGRGLAREIVVDVANYTSAAGKL